MAEILKLAFVGCGAISQFHLNGIRDRAAPIRIAAAALAAGPEQALGELRTALAMYRSAASRTWESVWD